MCRRKFGISHPASSIVFIRVFVSISTVPILFKNWVSSSGVANELPVGDGEPAPTVGDGGPVPTVGDEEPVPTVGDGGPVPTVGDIGPVPTVRDGKPAPTVEKRPQTEIERRHR